MPLPNTLESPAEPNVAPPPNAGALPKVADPPNAGGEPNAGAAPNPPVKIKQFYITTISVLSNPMIRFPGSRNQNFSHHDQVTFVVT